ncbi:MAG: ChrR family anti-sigma-E factor, partial [Pseudomonadota bacterium]|nr:ChrR family anti-sigma-E factor [Pseudomonadota bacterium]
GSLPRSQALCVAAHLHYCASCRAKNRELTELGAELFMQQQRVAPRAGEYERLLTRLGNDAPVARGEAASAGSEAPATPGERPEAQAVSILPRAVHRLANGNIEQLRWRKVGRNFRYSTLNVGDAARETSLLYIKAGGRVPRHRHAGDEITVILKGSFSDFEGKYGVGDFIVRTRGETHQPVASQDQDCLCLATLDAPIVMTNWLMRVAQRLFDRRPGL